MRVLHTYKVYRPDLDGGIPTIMSSLAQDSDDDSHHSILTARRFGRGRRFTLDGVPVHAVASLGTVFSMPLAPSYLFAFLRSARQADVTVHHAPFPFTDAALLLGLPRDVALVLYWHADIVGYPRFKQMISPLIRHALERADKIVVSGKAMIENSDLLPAVFQKMRNHSLWNRHRLLAKFKRRRDPER